MTQLRQKHEVYVSYSWRDDKPKAGNPEGLVTRLCRVLKEHHYRVIWDKEDCLYRESIDEFMKRIGAGKCIVTVLSDRYLRSENCMEELTLIFENRDMKNRIFPLVLPGTRIFKPEERVVYLKHWSKKEKEAQALVIENIDHVSIEGTTSSQDLHRRISHSVDNILGQIAKKMNCGKFDELTDKDFLKLRESIDGRLRDLENHRDGEQNGVP
jgi:hypothetical protein